MGQVLHAPDGSRDPAEVVLEAEQLLQRRLLDEEAVGDVEEVAVGQVQARQPLQAREGPRVQVADVLVVRHFQLHQVGEALRDRRGALDLLCLRFFHFTTSQRMILYFFTPLQCLTD